MGQALAEVIDLTATRQVVRYSAPGEDPVDVWAECDAGVAQDLTPWVAFLSPMAARQGHDLKLIGFPIDGLAQRNAQAALRLLSTWFPREITTPKVSASDGPATAITSNGTGCFFSGGVDSFYSVQIERERLTHLIFVHGFDVEIENESLAHRVLAELEAAASEIGLPLLLVRTNIRQLSDPVGLAWDRHYHGAALGGVAQLLRPHVNQVLVPSTFATPDLHPFGSHPALDPLWSSSTVEVVHHAPDASRPVKVATLIDDEVAMRHLRVCWRNPEGAYNCGTCLKCVTCRVLIALAGGEGRCSTLPATISAREVRSMEHDRSNRTHLRGALRDVADGSRPELEAAVRRVVRLGALAERSRAAARRVRRVSRRLLRAVGTRAMKPPRRTA